LAAAAPPHSSDIGSAHYAYTLFSEPEYGISQYNEIQQPEAI
jgi:hypothetical protein